MQQDAQAVKAADKERTKRAFVQFLGTALGVEQTYTTDDGSVYNAPGGFYSVNPSTGMSAESVTSQPVGFVITVDKLILGVIVMLSIAALRKA